MGEVYRAEDTSLGRIVALKTLPGDLVGTPDRRARFENEGRVMASLSHPNLVHVYDVGEYEGVPYLVQEFVEGETLEDVLLSGPGRRAEGRPLDRPGGRGARRRPRRGDPPPRHQALEPDGRAGRPDPRPRLRPREGPGGPGGQAAEPAVAHDRRSRRRDGAVHVAGAGEREEGRREERHLLPRDRLLRAPRREAPLRGGDPGRRHVRHPPPRARRRSPASGRGSCAGSPTSSTGRSPRTRRSASRRCARWRVAIEAVLAEREAGSRGGRNSARPKRAVPDAGPRLRPQSRPAGRGDGSRSSPSARASSPRSSARRSSGADGPVRAEAGAAPLRPVQLTSSAGLDVFPAFSPDGRALAYSSDRSGRFEIYRRPLVPGGREIQLTTDGLQNLTPAWSPDGETIAYHVKSVGGVWLLPSLGGVPRQLTTFGSRPSFSPDGKALVFESGLGRRLRGELPRRAPAVRPLDRPGRRFPAAPPDAGGATRAAGTARPPGRRTAGGSSSRATTGRPRRSGSWTPTGRTWSRSARGTGSATTPSGGPTEPRSPTPAWSESCERGDLPPPDLAVEREERSASRRRSRASASRASAG